MRHRQLGTKGLWVVSVAFLAFGLLLDVAAIRYQGDYLLPIHVPWVVLALGFVVTEQYTLRLEVRGEEHAISFAEVPMVFGLLFVAPDQYIAVRVVASVLTVLVTRRLPIMKVVFNAGLFATEAALGLLMFRALVPSSESFGSPLLLALLSAIGVAHLVSAGAVFMIMWLAGAPVSGRDHLRVLGVSITAAMAGTVVAVGSATAFESGRVLVWIPLLIVGGALTYFFVAFIRMRDRHRDLDTLHRFTSSLSGAETTVGLANLIVRCIAELLHARSVTLLVPIDGVMARVRYSGEGADVSEQLQVDLDEIDTLLDLAGSAIADAGVGLGIGRSGVLAVRLPLEEAGGLIVVDARMSAERTFDIEDHRMLQTAAGHAATAFHNLQLLTRLRSEANLRAHQALHDELTDLPNRRALGERLAQHLRSADRMVVMTVSVGELREVNATLGQASGDQMLMQIARRLQRLGEQPWWSRSSADEFTALFPGGPIEADAVSRAVGAAFRQPVSCDDVTVAVVLNVGFALSPVQGRSPELLLQRASLAARWSGVDQAQMTAWNPDRDPARAQQLRIAADLRDAIPAGELQVLFQPQMDLRRGDVVGVEALVRWEHPHLGPLTPDRFIPAAENTGAIDALTMHVIEVAARAGVRWRAQGWDLDVSVNLSARNLTNAAFADEVRQIIDLTGMPAESLTLELTESTVMGESQLALGTLHRLQAIGIRLSIDDFGTGFSSLAHLRRLPMSEIKIDKSFVLDLTNNKSDEVIVKSMVEMGRNLGLTVTVEGVETVEVRNRIAEFGSDRIQGYLLSRPLTESAFESWALTQAIRPMHDRYEDRLVQLFPSEA